MWIRKLASIYARLNLMGRAFGLAKGLTMNDYIAEFSRRAMVIHDNYIYANLHTFKKRKSALNVQAWCLSSISRNALERRWL